MLFTIAQPPLVRVTVWILGERLPHNMSSTPVGPSSPRVKSPGKRESNPARTHGLDNRKGPVVNDYRSEGVKDNDIYALPTSDWQLLAALTVLATVIRLFRIYQPTSVVFDEVQYVCFHRPLCFIFGLIVLIKPQLRRLRFEIHQGQILYGCPSSSCKDAYRSSWMACWF